MIKSSLRKNKHFQLLKKLYGEEGALHFFNTKGSLNFFGRKLVHAKNQIARLQKEINALKNRHAMKA